MGGDQMQSLENISPGAGIFAGSIMGISGVLVTLRGTGVIQAGEIYAPPWILIMMGAVFCLVALACFYYGIRNTNRAERKPVDAQTVGLPWLLACIIMTSLVITAGWISFGSGERRFDGGITGNPIEGRIAFGIATILFGPFTIYYWFWGIKRLWKRS